jgi:hypothetical protein
MRNLGRFSGEVMESGIIILVYVYMDSSRLITYV